MLTPLRREAAQRTEFEIAENPWSELPLSLAALLRPHLPAIGATTVRAVQRRVEDYRCPLDSPTGRKLVSAVHRSLEDFVELIEDPVRPPDRAAFFQDLGRLEFLRGRGTDGVQAAYRVGARVASRRYAAIARSASFPYEVTFILNDAVLAHISDLCGEIVKGHTAARAHAIRDIPRTRQILAEYLLDQRTWPSSEPVEALAARAEWPLPERVACVLVPSAPDGIHGLDDDILILRRGTDVRLIVPGPESPDRLRRLRLVFRNIPAVAGPPVPLDQTWLSLCSARLAVRLMSRSRRGIPGLTNAADNLPDQYLLHGAPLADLVADRVLLPLRDLPPERAARLAETLDALLMSWRRSAGEVAEALHIHPQTVRYRVRQLDTLFGPRLADPSFRFQAMIALRSRALNGTAPR
ncbi:helix-turn-helix domain-containing protein [Streptomyces sp. URMC 129]|uniref:helix-turn-helix domain-containing protein n=1 Tax=Streptomyces sp. URMC 129 TaxID=3423407 RepID=UPI003F1A086A